MLATPGLEPPPQPAIRTATAANMARAAGARRALRRSRRRPLTISAGRTLDRSFAATFLTYSRRSPNLVTATPGITIAAQVRDTHAATVPRQLADANERL
jgi:hypothetical protein